MFKETQDNGKSYVFIETLYDWALLSSQILVECNQSLFSRLYQEHWSHTAFNSPINKGYNPFTGNALIVVPEYVSLNVDYSKQKDTYVKNLLSIYPDVDPDNVSLFVEIDIFNANSPLAAVPSTSNAPVVHRGQKSYRGLIFGYLKLPTDVLVALHRYRYPTERHQLFLTHAKPAVHTPLTTKFDADRLMNKLRSLSVHIYNDSITISKTLGPALVFAPFVKYMVALVNRTLHYIMGTAVSLDKDVLARRKSLTISDYTAPGTTNGFIELLAHLTELPVLAELFGKELYENFSLDATDSKEKAEAFTYVPSGYVNMEKWLVKLADSRFKGKTFNELLNSQEAFAGHAKLKYFNNYNNLVFGYVGRACTVVQPNAKTTVEEYVAMGPLVAKFIHTIIKFTDITWKVMFEYTEFNHKLANKSLEELKSISIEEHMEDILAFIPVREPIRGIIAQFKDMFSIPSGAHSPARNSSAPEDVPTSSNRYEYSYRIALEVLPDIPNILRELHENGQETLVTFYSWFFERKHSAIYHSNNGYYLMRLGAKQEEVRNLGAHTMRTLLTTCDTNLKRVLPRVYYTMVFFCIFQTYSYLNSSNPVRCKSDGWMFFTSTSFVETKFFKSNKTKDLYSTNRGKNQYLKTRLE